MQMDEAKFAHQAKVEEAKVNHQAQLADKTADSNIRVKEKTAAAGVKEKKPKADPVANTAVEALKQLADNLAENNALLKAPRKLVRDAQGRPVSSVIG
jgi:hypothetical protein